MKEIFIYANLICLGIMYLSILDNLMSRVFDYIFIYRRYRESLGIDLNLKKIRKSLNCPGFPYMSVLVVLIIKTETLIPLVKINEIYLILLTIFSSIIYQSFIRPSRYIKFTSYYNEYNYKRIVYYE